MRLTASDLMKGAWYALEQCGLLLRDAVRLHEAGSYVSAVALCMFAREELGRHQLLVDFWEKARTGRSVTVKQVRKACSNHVDKQKAGALSTTLRTRPSEELHRVLMARSKAVPGTPEFEAASKDLDEHTQTKKTRTPNDREKTRERTLYVDVTDSGSWNLPRDCLDEATALNEITDAVNEYSIAFDETNGSARNPDFYAAVQAWHDRRSLPAPQWPKSLGGTR